MLLCKYRNKKKLKKKSVLRKFNLLWKERKCYFLSIIILPASFHSRNSVKPSDLCEGMLGVITVGLRELSISPVLERQRKDTGCDLLNAGHPLCIVSTTWGDIWHWQYSPVLRSPSSFLTSELCSIEALPAHSHANTQKAGADVKHLVLFLFTCKEIIIILRFCSSVCHKKKVHGGGHLLWWPSLIYM